MLRRNGVNRWFKAVRNYSTQNVIRTAGCIIIGDEILNSKIVDTNSRFFAKLCYQHGVSLKKIEVIGDNEKDIGDAVKEFTNKFDFTVTGGGIGSTHDDLTYRSVAKSYGFPLKLNEPVLDRARKVNNVCVPSMNDTCRWNSFKRMVELPYDPDRVSVYYSPTSWTPIVTIDKKISMLPGVPKFFEDLLMKGLVPNLKFCEDPYMSVYVVTKMEEISYGPYLESKQNELTKLSKEKKVNSSISLGSYPHFEKGVDSISITGRTSDKDAIEKAALQICKKVHGVEITKDQEFSLSTSRSFETADFLKGKL